MKLVRLTQTDVVTLGHLVDDEEKVLAVTCELPWRNNAHSVSCIPAGEYTAKRTQHPEHGEVFQVMDVPDRDEILLHIGCLPRDTKGCILLGTQFGHVDYADGKPGASGEGVTQSHAAFAAFMAAMNGIDSFPLTVVDP